MSGSDRAIQEGMKRIRELSHSLNLKANVIRKANEMFKQITDSGVLKGRSIDARVATLIFMASRYEDQPKAIKSILAFTECSNKELSKCYKAVKE
jgi:transcription initiation factor TFIIB